MARKRVTEALSEAELRLPDWLQRYKGWGDSEGNSRISERTWRIMRNKALGLAAPIKVHIGQGETLLTEIHTLLTDMVSEGLPLHFRDRAIAAGAAVEKALAGMATAKANRQAGAAKARALAGKPSGRPLVAYRVTDASGQAQKVLGMDAVAALTGYGAQSIRTQISQRGGRAELGRRNPETMWTVEVWHD